MAETPEMIIIMSTAPEHIAFDIGHALINDHLIACINLVPMRSMYLWEGRFCTERELLMIMKTTPERFDEVEKRIRALHPYDVPEIVALPVREGAGDFLTWVHQSVAPCPSDDPD